MEIKDFNKIVIFSLSDKFTRNVCKKLSDSLSMIYCDTKDLVEYELIDKNRLKAISKDFLELSERNAISRMASFTNVVISIGYQYLLPHYEILKPNSLMVFLHLPKTFIKEKSNTLNFIAYDQRSEQMERWSQVVIKVKKTDAELVKDKIIEKLGGML